MSPPLFATYRRLRTPLQSLAVGVALALGACTDVLTEATSGRSDAGAMTSPAFDIVDGSRGGGVSGFAWLTPTVTSPPSVTGTFDNTLLNDLTVELCEFAGTSCVAGGFARSFSSATGSSFNRVRLFPDRQYQVLYASASDNLDPAKSYRATVFAFGEPLGFVDIDVVASLTEFQAVDRTRYAALLRGQMLTMAFRVDVGTGRRARLPAAGGTAVLRDGAVTLGIPAGAVQNDVIMSADPLDVGTLPSNGRRLVPGTAWELGPDGLVFATPAVLTLKFDRSRLPSGTNPEELRIHKRVGDSYVQQPAGRVDLVNNTVSAETNGFSTYVIIARDPTRLEDRQAPTVVSAGVRSPSMSAFANLVELDVSGADAPYTFRVRLTDDLSGVSFVDVRYQSPSGRQERFPCYTGALPTSGSDTNGEWDCQTAMPRYAEAGDWTPIYVRFVDRVNNTIEFVRRFGGLCNADGSICVTLPTVRVLAGINDVTLPAVSAAAFSANTSPRAFVPELAVASSAVSQTIHLGFSATDDLSGVGSGLFFDVFAVELQDPFGQRQPIVYPPCTRTGGVSALDGFWECQLTLPAFAAEGTWRVARLRVPDRAGNGGWPAWQDDYLISTDQSQLCRRSGGCIPMPRIVVGGSGDANPPELVSVSVTNVGFLVSTSLQLSDIPSGVGLARVTYRSTETTQFQECFAQLRIGDAQNGTWGCDITFPVASASGRWELFLEVTDRSNNRRFYYTRRSDGWLCYDSPTGGQVCRDFGVAGVEFRLTP